MPDPGPDEPQRDYWPPPIWNARAKKPISLPADPPIIRRVKLPETVTVRYLAEIAGGDVSSVIEELRRLRLFLGHHRSMPFEAAARFLRTKGVGADREEV